MLSKCIKLNYKIARTTICLPVKVKTVIRCTGGGSGKSIAHIATKAAHGTLKAPVFNANRHTHFSQGHVPYHATSRGKALENKEHFPSEQSSPSGHFVSSRSVGGISSWRTYIFSARRNTGGILGNPSSSSKTQLIRPSTGVEIPKQGYARRSINNAAKSVKKNSQGDKNNPKINGKRHFEYQRELCIKTQCKTQDCKTLCAPQKHVEAVGHMSHGQSPAYETDKKTIPISNTDLDGNPKKQNAVMYKKPHKTPKTKEHINGTKKLNNEPIMKKNLMQHEDKS